jgi:histidinol dehydrogenase
MSLFGLRITDWSSLDPADKTALLERPAQSVPGLTAAVAKIIAEVRTGGDEALAGLTARLDGVTPSSLEINQAELSKARQTIKAELAEALDEASSRIRAFHAADLPGERTVETAAGLRCTVTYRPLRTVGIYIPGGSAPLVSTVLMLAIPARLAGCREVVMCTPPGRDGNVATEVLAAASLCGVDRVFCVGGAQAITAMAYGTDTVPRCNKVFGPGNAWVTEAKQQVSQDPQGAAIDLPAGPSEVMVIADGTAMEEGGADFIAWDLLSQAEHGADSQVILLASLAAARIILMADIGEAIEVANEYAPEHLILNVGNARQWSARVEHAGSVFIGRWTPESLGDYCSGTNHVLPTYGFARSHGALGVGDFMRRMTLQEASAEGLRNAGPCAETLARAEGLDAHRMALRSRLAWLETAS